MSDEAEKQETKEEPKEEGKSLKARDASLGGKIAGGAEILLGIIALVVLVCLGKLTADEAKQLFYIIMGCGFGVMGVFGTVDINLMLEKFSPWQKEQ